MSLLKTLKYSVMWSFLIFPIPFHSFTRNKQWLIFLSNEADIEVLLPVTLAKKEAIRVYRVNALIWVSVVLELSLPLWLALLSCRMNKTWHRADCSLGYKRKQSLVFAAFSHSHVPVEDGPCWEKTRKCTVMKSPATFLGTDYSGPQNLCFPKCCPISYQLWGCWVINIGLEKKQGFWVHTMWMNGVMFLAGHR